MTEQRTPGEDDTTPAPGDGDATPAPGETAPAPAHEATTGGDLMEVVVSVDDAHLPALADVVAELESAGMVVDQTMAVLGTVAGRVPQARLDDLGHVEGVAGIEPARRYQLPPPDSDVQ